MNKYLEKISSWKTPSKFIGYVAGTVKRRAASRLEIGTEVIRKKIKVKDLKREYSQAAKDTTKARLVAGAGGLAIGGAGAYAYKKNLDKQNKKIRDQYNIILKQASAGAAAKELGREATSGTWKLLKHIGSTVSGLGNSAGGGKIKNYGHMHGIGMKHKDFKHFAHGTQADQLKALKRNTKGPDRIKKMKEHAQNLSNLHQDKLHARIALGASGAAGISAYGWKKARDQNKKNNPYY